MMKRGIAYSVMLAMILGLMTGCFEHKHDLIGWEANTENHWQICDDCDEQVNFTLHWFEDDYGYCQVCEKTVTVNEDDTYNIVSYDETGMMNRYVEYDADGHQTFEMRYESEYDENGNPKHTKEYHDGVLIYEASYLPSETAEDGVYESEYVSYAEDGSKCVVVQNEQGMPLTDTEYDAKGKVIATAVYEYTYDEAGNLASQICRSDGIVSSEAYYALDEEGNAYVAREVFYDEDGAYMGEAKYDAEGNEIA